MSLKSLIFVGLAVLLGYSVAQAQSYYSDPYGNTTGSGVNLYSDLYGNTTGTVGNQNYNT